MKRREFIALLGGMSVLPVVAHGQRSGQMRWIGIMIANAENDPDGQARVTAFRQGLRELGWEEGRNIRIDYRWEVANPDRVRTYAPELVTLGPDVIVANGTPALAALHQATDRIPIVFVAVVDPVGAGYVRSLRQPGGNITGFSTFEPDIGGKWLELLKEITPNLRRVGAILDPDFAGFSGLWRAIERMAPELGLVATSLKFHDPTDDINSAIAKFAREGLGALIVLPTSINNRYRDRIFSLTALHRLPAIYPFPHYVTGGGLMSYGFDSNKLFRDGASYVDRILKGESPANLPVQAPTKFELVVNLKTAKSLGLTIPQSILARADAVIE